MQKAIDAAIDFIGNTTADLFVALTILLTGAGIIARIFGL